MTVPWCPCLCAVPSYESVHRVQATPWSYPEDLVSEVVGLAEDGVSDNERLVDLSLDPPDYQEDAEYLASVKLDLGIQVSRPAVIFFFFH